MRKALVGLSIVALSASACVERSETPAPARNVILMIADGGGYGSWDALDMYEGRWDEENQRSTSGFFNGEDWIRLSKSGASYEKGSGRMRTYNVRRARSEVPVAFPDLFRGYRWLRQTASDSAATATHMLTGRKTRDGSINVDHRGASMTTLSELAGRDGMAVGVVTTVQWSHATSAAAAGAHTRSRREYETIAREMLDAPYLKVLMGAGHPDYDFCGDVLEFPYYLYVGGEQRWLSIRDEQSDGWTLIDDPSEFRSLAQTGAVFGERPDRVLGTVKSLGTLQQLRPVAGDREVCSTGRHPTPDIPDLEAAIEHHRMLCEDLEPLADPPAEGVPDLPTMVTAALRFLEAEEKGFFLTIEGGAVDWAMHANQMERMIEEMIDFRDAIEAVMRWIEDQPGGWSRNLLVITADHDLMLFGPDAHEVPFQPIRSCGPGRLPAHFWLGHDHANRVVPLYLRGAGATEALEFIAGEDPDRGAFVDDTAVFHVMRRALGL